MTIHVKGTEQDITECLVCNAAQDDLMFESVVEILMYDHSNERYWLYKMVLTLILWMKSSVTIQMKTIEQ